MNSAGKTAIVLITDYPFIALKTARALIENKDEREYISHIYIYGIEKDKPYLPSAFLELNADNLPDSTVYHFWKPNTPNVPGTETFYGDFRAYNRKSIARNEVAAAAGKFRIVLMVDSDNYKQVHNDFDLRYEAYGVALIASDFSIPFCIYDDRGIAQTVNGELTELAS